MLESIFLKVLEQYLGDYVQEINRDQLKLGVLRGKIVLKDVALKHDALHRLDLPITIASGSIRELRINVPWSKLGSESVSLEAVGVDLTITSLHANSDVETTGEILLIIPCS
jgi:hypothetical protein